MIFDPASDKQVAQDAPKENSPSIIKCLFPQARPPWPLVSATADAPVYFNYYIAKICRFPVTRGAKHILLVDEQHAASAKIR